ncbi:MAG: TRAP transporter large permease subunit, partial [Pseudomonadota bacterium]|nr:TRAP transporter large permease subunit [Pseudomonadota bacterium]
MGIEIISLLMVGSLVLLLIIGMPMAYALGLVAMVFAVTFFGMNSLMLLSSRIYGFVNVYVLIAVPMFLMMASIMDKSGVAEDLYNAMRVWAGGMPGGVAHMTLLAAVFMAATTGIIGGEIILLGLVALPQMLRIGYDKNLAIGTICAGGSLGSMIPPSVVLIFYGLTAQVAIGDLFIAVIIPGLLLAGLYMVYITIRCLINPEIAPPVPIEQRNMSFAQKLGLIKNLILPLGVAFGVLGSIYAGIAAVSEAAAVGVAGTIVAAILRGRFSIQMLREALQQTMAACGLLLWLTFGATALIGVYNLLGGIAFVNGMISGLPFDRIYILLIMMLILIILGFFMDWVGILLLTMPIFVPIIKELGYDPVWFGILFCMNM